MEYKSNQHRQMAKVKNILSQIFFPKRLESSSHESYSGSCGDHAQWSLNPENGELRITGTGPLYDFFGEKEVPWESHLNHIRKVASPMVSLTSASRPSVTASRCRASNFRTH